jgi:hypothetical protein
MAKNEVAVAERHDLDDQTILRLVSDGDCSKLSAEQRLRYYRARCDAAGLDYRAQPFQYITLSGRLVLYALKGATDQLTAAHKIAVAIQDQRTEDGIRVVTVRATTPDGRSVDEIGAVPIANLKGDALANALMKASTKAKRRAILSVCGLGMLDETELETCAVTATNPAASADPGPAAEAVRPVRFLSDLAASSPPRPDPASRVSEGRAAATASEFGEDEYQTFRIKKAWHDLKEGVRKDGKPFSFTKHSASTEEGVRISTLKDDFGTLLKDGVMVSAVISDEAKYGSHEIVAIREVIEDEREWPEIGDIEI